MLDRDDEVGRLLDALRELPGHLRLRLAPYDKHGGEAPEVEQVWHVSLLAGELEGIIEDALAYRGVVRLGRAIWRDE